MIFIFSTSIVAGISRGIMFGLPYGVAVEVFGASRSVEVYTSLLLSFGIGGLSGSLVPGIVLDTNNPMFTLAKYL